MRVYSINTLLSFFTTYHGSHFNSFSTHTHLTNDIQMRLYNTNTLPFFFTAYHASHFNSFSTHLPITTYCHDHRTTCIITHKTSPNHPYHQLLTTPQPQTVQPPLIHFQTINNKLCKTKVLH